MEGLLRLLDTKIYTSEHDVKTRFMYVSILVRGLPFLKDERKSEVRIQAALSALKRHFLAQGRVSVMGEFAKLEKECS